MQSRRARAGASGVFSARIAIGGETVDALAATRNSAKNAVVVEAQHRDATGVLILAELAWRTRANTIDARVPIGLAYYVYFLDGSLIVIVATSSQSGGFAESLAEGLSVDALTEQLGLIANRVHRAVTIFLARRRGEIADEVASKLGENADIDGRALASFAGFSGNGNIFLRFVDDVAFVGVLFQVVGWHCEIERNERVGNVIRRDVGNVDFGSIVNIDNDVD